MFDPATEPNDNDFMTFLSSMEWKAVDLSGPEYDEMNRAFDLANRSPLEKLWEDRIVQFQSSGDPSLFEKDASPNVEKEACSDTEKEAGPDTGKEASPGEPSKSTEASASKDIKTRFIFRHWPRDPNGEVISTIPGGKYTPNDLPWGATLWDFYSVLRIPSVPGFVSFTTGSRLAATMRQFKELEHAKYELDWADEEADPVQLRPADIAELIEGYEARVRMGLAKSMPRVVPTDPVDTTPLSDSIFDISRYPSPWPLIPFSLDAPLLQQHIPRYLLPKKLVVHDPWNLLAVCGTSKAKDVAWSDKKDIIHTFTLQSAKEFQEVSDKEKEEYEKQYWNKGSPGLILTDAVTSGPIAPPILVEFPPPPSPPQSTPEAHLYLSPSHSIGEGHHSYVFDAELELPRSLLVDEMFCDECVLEEVNNMKESDFDLSRGIEEMELPYRPGRQAVADDLSPWGDNVGHVEVEERYIPALDMEIVPPGKEHRGKSPNDKYTHVLREAQTTHVRKYKGPIRHVTSRLQWQNPERGRYCVHIRQSRLSPTVPLTAKVRVAAKLSIQHDSHLAHEAKNYQAFPSHLSEHWSGYNLVRPIRDPVPVGAVVPKFYGYYVPDAATEGSNAQYLSPILLIENCGTPVDTEKLSTDEKQECASLLFRFHEAGWDHHSYYPRNIVEQRGPITQFPIWRRSDIRSFRLIDFGRSRLRDNNTSDTYQEERVAANLFDLGLVPYPKLAHQKE